ncbi:MAG: helix-turn-helix transcriptional regulator [Oscillospiraceae bacterium]|nr:helix-turn-helix transcriptional regulator [Oscillospiraceae bacterium]
MIKLIGEQINALRKFFGLNQAEFGAKIGLKGSSVSNYEVGRVSVPDSVILSICREYGCDETWLRTGEGEMFRPRNHREQVVDYLSRLLRDPSADFQLRLIELISEIPPEFWPLLEEKARSILFPDGDVKT